MSGRVHFGTSGWTYDHWLGRFYPREERKLSRLQQYARSFRSVEINASFYRMPTPRAMQAWLDETPDDFVFAAKVSRFITHRKRLREPDIHIPIFFPRIFQLKPKLGPLLVQLPPNFRCDMGRLAAFADLLPPHRYAFEFRHESWWSEEVYDYLRSRNLAFCQYHLAGRLSPNVVTADFVYVRLHGPGAAYQGSYDDHTLQDWAAWVGRWRAEGRDVYMYFDNDEKAYAAEDARRMQDLVPA
ncbi:DUF72 domain-containing protein [Roseitranquillus sediminis]|uniref:DUF72 domain-containing protein n=1 Tax=Roseitranquillus sediminis TaxID=2809051 RepID=UPI001D0C0C8F|nr:DUF72 domain-containing protein [Roseitranquillus sediminis]MBM9593267.1 DUF72 domain-containing protein [Roseitranquillus sediminis]